MKVLGNLSTLGNVDFNDIPTARFVFETVDAAPSASTEGRVVYSKTSDALLLCVKNASNNLVWYPVVTTVSGTQSTGDSGEVITGGKPGAFTLEVPAGTPLNQWILDHGLATKKVFVQIIDHLGNQIIPASIVHQTNDRVEVNFSEPVAGTALVFSLDTEQIISSVVTQEGEYRHAIGGSPTQSAVVINHGLDTSPKSVLVSGRNGSIIVPDDVTHDAVNKTTTVTFDLPSKVYVESITLRV